MINSCIFDLNLKIFLVSWVFRPRFLNHIHIRNYNIIPNFDIKHSLPRFFEIHLCEFQNDCVLSWFNWQIVSHWWIRVSLEHVDFFLNCVFNICGAGCRVRMIVNINRRTYNKSLIILIFKVSFTFGWSFFQTTVKCFNYFCWLQRLGVYRWT